MHLALELMTAEDPRIWFQEGPRLMTPSSYKAPQVLVSAERRFLENHDEIRWFGRRSYHPQDPWSNSHNSDLTNHLLSLI
jgi:hypothetical protein